MTERYVPVETEVGVLRGRTVFLDEITHDYREGSLFLRGSLFTEEGEELVYGMKFLGIIFFSMVELDLYKYRGLSAFDEIVDSKLVESFKDLDSARKITPGHRHFRLITYDDAIQVVCSDYVLSVRHRVTTGPSSSISSNG